MCWRIETKREKKKPFNYPLERRILIHDFTIYHLILWLFDCDFPINNRLSIVDCACVTKFIQVQQIVNNFKIIKTPSQFSAATAKQINNQICTHKIRYHRALIKWQKVKSHSNNFLLLLDVSTENSLWIVLCRIGTTNDAQNIHFNCMHTIDDVIYNPKSNHCLCINKTPCPWHYFDSSSFVFG